MRRWHSSSAVVDNGEVTAVSIGIRRRSACTDRHRHGAVDEDMAAGTDSATYCLAARIDDQHVFSNSCCPAISSLAAAVDHIRKGAIPEQAVVAGMGKGN